MFINLSVLENIDFKNTDNLLFFSIVLFLVIVIFFVLFFVVAEIIGAIKRSIRVKQGYVLEKIAMAEMDTTDKKQPEKNQEHVENSKQKLSEEVFAVGASSAEKNKTGTKLGGKKAEEEKQKKEILGQLNKLKKDSDPSLAKEDSLESKMPSMEKDKDGHEEIKIPVARKLEEKPDEKPEEADDEKRQHSQPLQSQTDKGIPIIPKAKSVGTKTDKNLARQLANNLKIIVTGDASLNKTYKSKNMGYSQKEDESLFEEKPIFEKPDFMREKNQVSPSSNIKVGNVQEKNNQSIGGSIMFGNKDEVSRIELRQKLRNDPKIYQAQKEAGLYNLDKISRAKMEKDLFSTVYGRNISKGDLRVSVKKLEKAHWGATDAKKKETLRKEIKFLKKIGGV